FSEEDGDEQVRNVILIDKVENGGEEQMEKVENNNSEKGRKFVKNTEKTKEDEKYQKLMKEYKMHISLTEDKRKLQSNETTGKSNNNISQPEKDINIKKSFAESIETKKSALSINCDDE